MHPLKIELKVILRHSSVYLLSNALGQVLSFLLLPLYTRYLTPTDYGALEILYFISSILGIAIGFGVAEGMGRFYFDRDDPQWRSRVISTSVIGMAAICAASAFLLLPFSGLAARTFLDAASYTIHFRVLFVSLAAQFMTALVAGYLRVREKSTMLLLLSVAQTLATIALNVLFIARLHWGSLGMLSATLIVHGVTAIVAVAILLVRTGARFDRGIFVEMLRFGLPLIPSSLGSYVVIASDRYFLKSYASLADTGLYSLGYKLGAVVHSFVTSPFIQIWMPRRFQHFGQGDSERVYARIFSYFLALLTFAALGICLLARDLVQVLTTPQFWSAWRIVPIIAVAHIIHAFYYHFTVPISYWKRTRYYAYLNVSVGVLNLALNFLLIPRWGMWGAAVATLATYTCRSAFVYILARRLQPIEFEAGKALRIVGGAAVLYLAGALLADRRLVVDILIQTGILLCYPPLLVLTGVSLRANWRERAPACASCGA